MLTLRDIPVGCPAVFHDGKLAVVIEHKPSNPKNSVIFQMKAGGTRYKGAPNQFRAVVGTVMLADWNDNGGEAPPPRRTNNSGTDSDFFVPEQLKGIKIGDQIRIRGRRGNEVVTYRGYKSSRPKYPVCFTTLDGRDKKGTISLVIGKVE